MEEISVKRSYLGMKRLIPKMKRKWLFRLDFLYGRNARRYVYTIWHSERNAVKRRILTLNFVIVVKKRFLLSSK
jgi:hypothetical protein